MLFAVAALFNMSLSLTGELSGFSKRAINEDNCPDGYILTIGTNNFKDHFLNDNDLYEVESVSVLSGRTVTAPINCNGKDISQLYDMILWRQQAVTHQTAWIIITYKSPPIFRISPNTHFLSESILPKTASTYKAHCVPVSVFSAPPLQ